MPINDYVCEECQEPFELFVRSISATVNPVCPKCGSRHVEKEASAVSALGVKAAVGAACAPSG